MNTIQANQRPVTIVIPAYGDVPSLLKCIASVKRHVDLSKHSVLVVNDNGPEAELIEQAVGESISDTPSIRYERNSVNLGFVGNCNRAVLELDQTENDVLLLNSDTVVTPGFLDEMIEVLHLSPSHGVVCARSNNATIASLPFRQVIARPRHEERTKEVFEDLALDIPRFNVSPVAMGFCFLIRRELIPRFGLFDEVFSPGYGEENDFCLRINEHGFQSVIANRALVFHGVAASFTNKRREVLRREHGAILSSRYPHYDESVRSYLLSGVDPVEHFADAITPRSGPHRIVVEAGDVDPQSLPTASALLDALRCVSSERVELFLSVDAHYYAKSALRFRGVTVVPSDKIDGIFDLAIIVDPSPDMSTFGRMARLSCKWAILDMDPARLISWSQRMALPHGGYVLQIFDRLSDVRIYANEDVEGGFELVPGARTWGHPDVIEYNNGGAIEELIALAKSRPASFEPLRMRSAIAGWELAATKSSFDKLSSYRSGVQVRVFDLLRRIRRRVRALIDRS
ncbi:GT2 family glycosyltransferase [Microcella alkaliphila]|uniref:GT2 family glycosyltransferase n=1 Tax=Microcella alkaliphila TaxID=279828 RepID=A0A4Q7TAU0_9MICO|nr:glycosyltransferase family 2 protein [Microcella alkaliphila]RZT57484.1 GT2 family glycosyltransferase [Microcella alkaliphila]